MAAIGTQEARPSLRLVRHYEAPPQKVWRAWTDPQTLKRWFGPDDDGEVLLAEVDLRVGGRYRLQFQSPGGELNDVGGQYREVEPHRRLVFTWAWKSTPERESVVTLQFRPTGAGTEFVFLQEAFFDQAARDRHASGWAGAFAKLDRVIAAG
jgi:uncharacterized protein YndB with AHSA1/START domain